MYKAVRGNTIEMKAKAFDGALLNAKMDIENPQRLTLILQAFIDEVYRFRKLGDPPVISAQVIPSMDKAGHKIISNIASKLGADWKPVVFGNWARDRIEKLIK